MSNPWHKSTEKVPGSETSVDVWKYGGAGRWWRYPSFLFNRFSNSFENDDTHFGIVINVSADVIWREIEEPPFDTWGDDPDIGEKA